MARILTPEQRQHKVEKERERRATMTPAARERDREVRRAWRKRQRESMTPDDLAARRARVRQWLSESPEQRESRREYNREWRAKNPDYHRRWLASRTPEQRQEQKDRSRGPRAIVNANFHHQLRRGELVALYEQQQGRCAICDQPAPLRGKGCLVVDHDHATGERRGLICNRCNVALPVWEKVGPEWALQALAYLGDPPLRRLRQLNEEGIAA
jgi:hypothetical protein